MKHPIGVTCGTQFAAGESGGQTLPELRRRAAVRQTLQPEVDDPWTRRPQNAFGGGHNAAVTAYNRSLGSLDAPVGHAANPSCGGRPTISVARSKIEKR